MRSLCGLAVLALVLAYSNGTRYGLRDFDDADDMASILRERLVSRFVLDESSEVDSSQSSDSDEKARAAAKKCTSVQQGKYFNGDSQRSIENIGSYQDCMTQCENDNNCYGWAYQSNSKLCTLQNSIGWPKTDPSYVGGSCIGPAAKERVCKEKLPNTIYNGDNGPYFSAATVEECMRKCDSTPTCLGYMFNSAARGCQTQTAQDGKGTVNGWTGGSCVVPKPAYPLISIEEFRQQALDQHNIYRREHCAPPLKLNATLNNIAQKYAEYMAATNKWGHSGNKLNGQSLGENLYRSGRGQVLYTRGSAPVTVWYDEIQFYDWANPRFTKETGHFSQVVWKGSTQLGIGRGITKDRMEMFVVGSYFPAGNMGGHFEDNVEPSPC